jgi:hypothetical protein
MLPQADWRVLIKKHSLMGTVSFATAVLLICLIAGLVSLALLWPRPTHEQSMSN